MRTIDVDIDIQGIRPDEFQARFALLADHVGLQLRGKRDEVEKALICLISRGHLLIEDVPGVGKTVLARALSDALKGAEVKRVQGTPDLLPSDIRGSSIYHRDGDTFTFEEGPIFTNVLHCDEINRIPPRTQSALLDAMEERMITVRGKPRELPTPFFVVATQNPIEMSGTYPLPEAQLDRFLMRLKLGYPADTEAETEILRDFSVRRDLPPPVMPVGHVQALITRAETVYVADPVLRYVAELVRTSRERARLGASPRAGIALLRAARVRALADGRDRVQPEDVAKLADAVLAHRLLPAGGADPDDQHKLVADLLAEVRPPQDVARRRHA